MGNLSKQLDNAWVCIEISQARITEQRYDVSAYQLNGSVNSIKGIFATFKVDDFDQYQDVRDTYQSDVRPKVKTALNGEDYNEDELTEALLALMDYVEQLRDVIHESDAYDDQIQLRESPEPIQKLRKKQ